jgi:hypothetical protein
MRGKAPRERKPRDPRGVRRPAGPHESAADRSREVARAQVPPAEDFVARRDIETADEPVEEHDRRYHDGDRST